MLGTSSLKMSAFENSREFKCCEKCRSLKIRSKKVCFSLSISENSMNFYSFISFNLKCISKPLKKVQVNTLLWTLSVLGYICARYKMPRTGINWEFSTWLRLSEVPAHMPLNCRFQMPPCFSDQEKQIKTDSVQGMWATDQKRENTKVVISC